MERINCYRISLKPGISTRLSLNGTTNIKTTLQGGVLYRVYSRVEAFIKIGSQAGVAANTPLDSATPIAQYTPEILSFGKPGETVQVYGITLGDSGDIYFTPMIEVTLP